jgi:trimethylamine--corrinoid protein Co-methyltransferase
MLELGMSFSMEQLVMDDDMIGMMRYAKRGIEVNPETIAYESIRDVGIGNNFLGYPDTIANFDKPSHPLTFDRDMYDSWVGNGSKDDTIMAHERVQDILANHECTPIAHRDLVDAVIKKADDRFHHKA